MDEAELQPGKILSGKYRIERILGRGGMGVVVAARHLHLDQVVAIKLILKEAARRPEAIPRLLREARAAAHLRSEHVVRVFDVGMTEHGTPFIVMEYLEGTDLAQVAAERGRLPLPVAVDYVLQACDALAEAHDAGIVHRDIKPGNLFLATSAHGRQIVKVVDFGIAKVVDPAEGDLTRSATVMGSPAYMSPEQLRSSRNVDARADIWSLGIILWQLVSGSVPFAAETFSEVVVRISVDPLPPLPKACGVPYRFERVLARALEKDPGRRYQSVGELAHALAPFANPTARELALRIASRPRTGQVRIATADGAVGERRRAPTPGTRRGRRLALASATVALGAGVIAAIVALREPEPRVDGGLGAAGWVDATTASDVAPVVRLDAAAALPDAGLRAIVPPPPPPAAPDARAAEAASDERPRGDAKKRGKLKKPVVDPFGSPD